MDLFGFLWDWHQGSRIDELQEQVSRLRHTPPPSDPICKELNELKVAHGELRLFLAALLRLLEQKGIIGREELRELVQQVDQEDGKVDNAHEGELLK